LAQGATALAAAFGAAGIAACGAQGGESGGAASAPKSVAGQMTWFMRASGAELQWEQAAVGAYKQQTPSVTVNLETVSTSAEFDPKLTALVAGGTPPDVWTHWGQSGFGDYYAKGIIGEIQSFVARDKLDMGPFFANVHDAWKKDGKLYGLSFNTRFGTFVYFNRDLFQRAGVTPPPVDWEDKSWTWDKMLESARKIANPGNKVWGFAAGAQPRTWGMAYLFGGDFFTKDHYQKGIAKESNMGSPDVLAAMQAEADLINKLKLWPSNAEAQAAFNSTDYSKIFASGNLAMLFDTGSEWASKIDPVATFDWGIAAAPRQKDNKVINFINPLMIAKDSKNKEAAWSFVKYNVSEPGQKVLVQFAFQPVLKALLDEWLKSSKMKQPAADVKKAIEGAAPHTQIGPNQIMADFGPVRTAVDESLAPVWAGTKSTKDALTEAKQKVDALLAESYARYGGK
jgi:multiple sugar transport system substrate-binding protein